MVNRGAKTAVSAARWCQDAASSDDAWLVELLRSASSYWLEHEEPYPKSGGIVPDSPREALLRTLCGIAPLAFEELANLTKDPRSDVKDAAIDGVIGLAVKSCDEKSRLVESIVAKRFTSQASRETPRQQHPIPIGRPIVSMRLVQGSGARVPSGRRASCTDASGNGPNEGARGSRLHAGRRRRKCSGCGPSILGPAKGAVTVIEQFRRARKGM